jgi:arylsulfatase
VSFAQTFDEAEAPTRHYTQYFEIFGHRAIDHKRLAGGLPVAAPSFAEADVPFGTAITAEMPAMLDAERWELYNSATTSRRTATTRTTTSVAPSTG